MSDKQPWKLRLCEVSLLLTTAVALYLLLALISYHPQDSGWTLQNTLPVQNVAGMLGAWVADFTLSFLGYFGFLLPFGLAYGMWVVYQERPHQGPVAYTYVAFRLFGATLTLMSGSALATWVLKGSVDPWLPQGPGGIIGQVTYQYTFDLLGPYGSLLVFLTGLLIGITLFTGFSWFAWLGRLVRRFFASALKLMVQLKNQAAERSEQLRQRTPLAEKKTVEKPLKARHAPTMGLDAEPQPELQVEADLAEPPPAAPAPVSKNVVPPMPKLRGAAKRLSNAELKTQEIEAAPTQPTAVKTPPAATLPSIDLLDEPAKKRITVSDQAIEDMSRALEARLAEFNVQATVEGVCPGPVVTRFELQLAPGIKVSKLSGLAKDLARAMSVLSVRIVEVIPGKTFVGLEIPNEKREMVRLKEVLDTPSFKDSTSPITLALGKDIAGHPMLANLGKMPHLLVAGTTGSGKSVGVNAMLISMLLKAGPEALRLILIDPKMLELSVYEGIPHLLTPVVTDMKEAAAALRWSVKEMDRRYALMSKLGVRNLAGLNDMLQKAVDEGQPILDPTHPEPAHAQPILPIPHIVVVVDEFADMMMVVGKKVEELITRLAQKARAAGIHLILATQRPSVDVITGLIKANIPTRIAFQVSSKIDSRTVLDQQGAEQLLGHGDMLYLPPGTGVPVRVHGAFVADHEVHSVVNAWKSQSSPEYIDEITQEMEDADASSMGAEAGGEQDALYDEAVNIVIDSQRASISNVQRRLKIGYNRAARLIEEMEAAGVVSQMQPNGLREVLVPKRD